jgi:asparagine synthase (glutamine-hydrolysing)
MCGICGVFGLGDVDTVRAMLGSLSHRGPDDAHTVGQRDFAGGASRLSIVDVEVGGNKVLALVVFQEWHDMYMMGGE